MEDKGLFYKGFDSETPIDDFILLLEKYAISSDKGNPVYIVKNPLGNKKYEYDYDEAVVILIPNYKILFLNYGNDFDAFEEYVEEFIDDVGHISNEYDYQKYLGRSSKWRKEFTVSKNYDEVQGKGLEEILTFLKLSDGSSCRKGEFLISLITGSINDIDEIGIDYPQNILEQVKNKIVLFDGDQTRFIYDEPKEKRITIQGLAGTGKTELLLHKIKEIYTKDENAKIVFTCHNKILAENLKNRLPSFFDFMKVTEQIKWEERLWVMSSWGSKSDINSGVYSYICNFYNIPFERFSYAQTFDVVCRHAIESLEKVKYLEPCFDYILIDESQDFTENFFSLCGLVTKKRVYVAGDIFQNVFDEEAVSKVNPQFLLNKCYRTDPKTLMCAHAIGMGLFEPHEQLRWLSDKGWNDCGYDFKKKDGHYYFYRKPLRRFENIEGESLSFLEMYPTSKEKYFERIIQLIRKICQENETVEPDDIAIMFLENSNQNYNIANQLVTEVKERFGWDVNIGYETKVKQKGTLFISNRNNVKGLEFPFVICFMQGELTNNLQTRNSIYMMLTRSFLTSYFILPDKNEIKNEQIKRGINQIGKDGYMDIVEPTAQEKSRIHNAIINGSNIRKSQRDIVDDIMDELKIPRVKRKSIHSIINGGFKDVFDRDVLYEIIRTNYNMMT